MLTAKGLRIEEVYDLPLDVLYLYLDAALRLETRQRLGYIADTTASIGGMFSKGDKLREYMSTLERATLGDDDG